MVLAAISLRAEESVLPAEAVALLPGVPMQPTRPGPEEGRITETDAGFLLESLGELGKMGCVGGGQKKAGSCGAAAGLGELVEGRA